MSALRSRWRVARYRRVLRRLAGPKLLAAFAAAHPEAYFVEIGANDGDKYDQLQPLIRSSAWAGIMVEPVPYVFARLEGNYGDLERVALVNAAIADRDGTLPFFHLAEAAGDDDLPPWYDAIGSFSRDTVLRHGDEIDGIEARLVATEVPTLTFASLLARQGAERVDLLLVDTEGYDAEILGAIDFAVHHPRLVAYEHYHLPPAERAACRARMEGFGYETLEEGFDTFCLDPAPADSLTRRWRALRPGVPGVSRDDEGRA